MKKLLIALSVLLLSACAGIQVAEQRPDEAAVSPNGMAMVITQYKPCTNEKILENLKEQYHPAFQEGIVATADGKRVPICWAKSEDIDSKPGYRVFINEQGSIGGVAEDQFFKASEETPRSHEGDVSI